MATKASSVVFTAKILDEGVVKVAVGDTGGAIAFGVSGNPVR
jgi:hypothetical protein